MDQINNVFAQLSKNYLLIGIAATIFFIAKAITGYLTYRHINKKFKNIERKLDMLLQRQYQGKEP